VATTGFIPGDDPWLIWKYRLMGDQSENTAELHVNRVAGDYVKLFNLHIVSGRDFSKDRTSARFSGEVIMNEKAIHQLNIETPEEAIGEKIISHNNDTAEIVGVVEDFHQESLEEPIDPLIFINYDYVFQNYVMSFQSSHIQKDIKQLKKLYADFFPGNPFEYFFLDQYFDTQYKAEMRFSKIFGLFTLLAIFISCIGLFGLTFLLVQHRMKEIGIRKAMGASVFSIYKTISADFIKLNTLSIALGLPVAYFTFKSWLNNYAFKIEIEEWFVITPIITIFTISILTISFKVLKAANINPADSLRDE
jgi:putative ABC transport system permease protein